MAAVLTIGSSLIDVFVHSDEFHLQQSSEGLLLCQKYGEKIEVSDFSLHTGGGGSNTAVGFSRLGHTVSVVSELGKDAWADIVLRDLEKEQVATTYLVHEKKEKTGGSIILVGVDGGRTVLVHRGAASQLNPTDIPTAAVESSDWIHISSISGQVETLRMIFSTRVRANKKNVSWNPGKTELQKMVDREIKIADLPIQVLFLNKQEWEIVASLQSELQSSIPEIIVTDGARGGQVFIAGQQHTFSVAAAESVDDTGAGDAFATGYVAGRLAGVTALQALEWAKASSRAVVLQVGAKPGLLTKSTLEQAITHVS